MVYCKELRRPGSGWLYLPIPAAQTISSKRLLSAPKRQEDGHVSLPRRPRAWAKWSRFGAIGKVGSRRAKRPSLRQATASSSERAFEFRPVWWVATIHDEGWRSDRAAEFKCQISHAAAVR
ncbi:hypothetical protein L1887_42494 [Cichorium endivia]|nr:hypothetical protein L1887_42494 [Cichorium endivia]